MLNIWYANSVSVQERLFAFIRSESGDFTSAFLFRFDDPTLDVDSDVPASGYNLTALDPRDGIRPGRQASQQFSISFSPGHPTWGRRYILFVADWNDNVREISEKNNLYVLDI